jgi:hypothetical protein
MESLYSITQQQRYTLLEIEELAGELTPELEEKLSITALHLESKSMAYLEVIATKEGFNDLIDNEIKRLQAIKKANNNLVTRLKDNLLIAVKLFGEFTVGTHSFGTRKSVSVQVDTDVDLKDKFKTIKVSSAPNKAAIKKALQQGEEIEGCSLVENLNLKIK